MIAEVQEKVTKWGKNLMETNKKVITFNSAQHWTRFLKEAQKIYFNFVFTKKRAENPINHRETYAMFWKVYEVNKNHAICKKKELFSLKFLNSIVFQKIFLKSIHESALMAQARKSKKQDLA